MHGGLRYLARGDSPADAGVHPGALRAAADRAGPGRAAARPDSHGSARGAGTAALGAALALTHVLSLDPQSRPADQTAASRPAGSFPGPNVCELLPALAPAASTGGALWYDARMTRPERLTLAFVAVRGRDGCAVAANHAEAEAFDLAGDGAVRAVEVVATG